MPTQAIPDRMRRRQMPDVISARVPPGFGDQVREAARAEGVGPGALIRDALAQRIERTGGAQPMTDAERETVVSFGGEGLARTVERAATDPEFKDSINREIDAARFRFMVCITAAYEHLGAYIDQQSARNPDEAQSPDEVVEAVNRLILAYNEMEAAYGVEIDLGRLVCRLSEADNGAS